MKRSFCVGLFLIGVAYAAYPSNEYLPPASGSHAAPSVHTAPSKEYLPPTSYAATNNHASFVPAPQPVAKPFVPAAAPVQTFAATNNHASFVPAPQPVAKPFVPAVPPVQTFAATNNHASFAPAPQPVAKPFVPAAVPVQTFAATNNHASFAPAPQPVAKPFVPAAAPVHAFAATNNHVSFAPAPQPAVKPFVAAAPSIQRSSFVAPPSGYLPPVAAASEPAPAHILANDGYHYKTVRRRYRRGSPTSEYLPPLATEQHETIVASPSKQSNTIIAPPEVSAKATLEDRVVTSKVDSYAAQPSGASPEIVAAASSPPAHSLEGDGYHYKTVKRYRLRRY